MTSARAAPNLPPCSQATRTSFAGPGSPALRHAYALLLALAMSAAALPVSGCGPKYVEPADDDDDDDGEKKKKKKKKSLSPESAFKARWVDKASRAKCAAGPLLMDRTLELEVVPDEGGSEGSTVNLSFELCGPADAEAGERLRLVWNKGGMAMVETTCDPPRTPGGEHPRNPRLVRCAAAGIPFGSEGDHGVDIYLRDELLLDARFNLTMGSSGPAIDPRPRGTEAWLGWNHNKDGRPNRMVLELPIPREARVTVIYAWYRGEEDIFKAREVEPDEFTGRIARMVGPRYRDVIGRDGDYKVTVSIDAAPAWEITFTVADGAVIPLPRQEADAGYRINDRFMLVKSSFLGHSMVVLPDETSVGRYGLWGKLAE